MGTLQEKLGKSTCQNPRESFEKFQFPILSDTGWEVSNIFHENISK